jgi:hypothetical protein
VLLFGLLTGGAGRAPRVLEDKVRAGVGARTGACLRKGDSGRGREGRLALKVGLLGRTPGPTDCENFRGIPGIGGVFLASPLERCEGVPGVAGKLSSESAGESRRSARWTGRKMPAPGIEVVK